MANFNLTVPILFDGEQSKKNQTLVIKNGTIDQIFENISSKSVKNHLLIPGYIDLQVNGGGGLLFNDSPTAETISTIAKVHQTFGTTAWLPTLVTDSFERMQTAADAIAQSINSDSSGVIGIHFEGPFLSKIKKGVHQESLIREMSTAEFDLLTRQDIGKVLLTIAPENFSNDSIKRLTQAGVIISIGHSNASFKQTNQALQAGATSFTHLFNAMSAFESREPGVVGAALLDKESTAGIILDGIHVHPYSARLAATMKNNLYLVTDAMPPVGSKLEDFEFFGKKIKRQGNRLVDNDDRLAGSTLNMHQAVNNAVSMLDIDFFSAIKMATINPAKTLGLEKTHGKIAVGQRANMILLDSQKNIISSWVNGVKII